MIRSLLSVCDITPAKFGTFERYLLEFGRKCASEGTRLTLLLSGEPVPAVAAALGAAGIPWRAAPGWKDAADRESRRHFLRHFLRAAGEEDWDAVSFQFCQEVSVAAACALARALGRGRFTGLWVQQSQVAAPRRLGRWLSRARLASAVLDGFAVPSEMTRSVLVARGCPPAKVRVIPNGIGVPEPRPGRPLREELGLPPDARLLVGVGSLIRRKGFDLLLNAAAPLLAERPPWHLLVVGGGPLRAELEGLSASLGVAGRTHFLGLRDDVPGMLLECDAFSLASRSEGLTFAVLEGMAAGLPVVTTDVGGHREVIGEREGVVVPPEDVGALREGLRRVLDDPDGARAMGRAAREKVLRSYRVEQQVEAQYRFLEELAAARGRGGRRRVLAAR